MARLIVITHPEVHVEPGLPVPDWPLTRHGRQQMKAFAEGPICAGVTAIWTSPEVKAQEAASILSKARDVAPRTDRMLAENDRSATGYLPAEEFESTANQFFAFPEDSIRGWERAVDAQARIRLAVTAITLAHPGGGDIAVVTHGAVGTLLYCAFRNLPISRRWDQPKQGHYWVADLTDLMPQHHWLPLSV
ncbi:histidine phosphatase family protein [Pararhodobacter sp. CCB-MM2]|uniref:histidine phosphatase family protein n=1 Tax=Pararhodobacter sp. CCB-MM2 TaxID=1786003 RepID=UPI00082E19B8|nr:histidine phosphatase family protein [Pararhodobacter sp. CCB-MM2]